MDPIQLQTFLAVMETGSFSAAGERLHSVQSNITVRIRKLEAELGWKPAETFETGIRKTVQWYLDNPQWVANVQSGAYREWVGKQYGEGK